MYGIILAGGRGERMGQLTKETPKPMLRVGGKPLLQYQIEQLREAGATDVIIVEGYLPKVIQEYFGDGKKFGIHIRHLVVDTTKGSAGATREALQSIPETEKDIPLLYGDILSDTSIKRLMEKHKEIGDIATLSTVSGDYLHPDGLVAIDQNGMLKEIKTATEAGIAVNAAIFALNREKMLSLLPEKGDLSRDVWEPISKTGRLTLFQHEGYWRNMTNAFDILQAERDIKLGLLKVGIEASSSSTPEAK